MICSKTPDGAFGLPEGDIMSVGGGAERVRKGPPEKAWKGEKGSAGRRLSQAYRGWSRLGCSNPM